MKCSAVQCSVGKGVKTRLYGKKFIWVVKWWEVKGWGESVSTICVGKNTRNYIQYFLTFVLFTFCTCCILRCLVCIVVILCVLAVLCVYCCFYFRCRTAGIRKVLRPATSTQGFLGFPVPKSKCWDDSQDSKLPLHASHVAPPPIKFISYRFHILCTCKITTETGWQPNCSYYYYYYHY